MNQFQTCRAYLEASEAEQLRRFPVTELHTPLEHAQCQLAMDYLRRYFRLENLSEDKAKIIGDEIDRPIVFKADVPTRRAFFEYFEGERDTNIFCWRREEMDSLTQFHSQIGRFDSLPYALSYHEFIGAQEIGREFMKSHYRFSFCAPYSLDSVFVRKWGFVRGPLDANGQDSLWTWDGKELAHLPKHDSRWVS